MIMSTNLKKNPKTNQREEDTMRVFTLRCNDLPLPDTHVRIVIGFIQDDDELDSGYYFNIGSGVIKKDGSFQTTDIERLYPYFLKPAEHFCVAYFDTIVEGTIMNLLDLIEEHYW